MRNVKWLALLMSLVLLCGCLTACGKDKEEEKAADNSPKQNKLTSAYGDKAYGFQLDTPEDDDTIAVMHTSMGDIAIRLFPEAAPKTVENFTTHAKDGYYNGLTFHRVINDFMIQGGDPKGDGTGGSDSTIKGEFKINGIQNDLSHVAGVISMARKSMPYDSATSQFFICNADASGNLDGSYAAFGYVVAGLDTVMSISDVEVTTNAGGEKSQPLEKVTIVSIRFVKKN